MIEDLNLQMLRLIINVQIIERRLREQPHKYYDSLLNPTTSSSQAILKFTDIALSELKYMEDAYLLKAIKVKIIDFIVILSFN